MKHLVAIALFLCTISLFTPFAFSNIISTGGNGGINLPVSVQNGGTGASSLAGHGVLVMNAGGSAVTSVAPGASGNVLTSDGTNWSSGAAGVTIGNTVTGGTAGRFLYEGTGPVLADSAQAKWLQGPGATTQMQFGNFVTPTLTIFNISTAAAGRVILRLDEHGSDGNAWNIDARSSDSTLHVTYSGTDEFTVDNTGAIKMPNLAASSAATTGTVCWTAGGNLTVDTTVACLSSIRKIKERIRPLNKGIEEVMKLEPISYNLKPEYNPKHLGRMVGFIADDVQKIDERLVARDEKGELVGVRYMQLTAVLTKAIQEQQAEIVALKKEVRKLREGR